MINLDGRSYQKELLDNENLPFEDIRRNMQELNTINRFLGGHKVSISGMKKILEDSPVQQVISICEIGCGGGDNLLAIQKWCARRSINAKFIGIDIKNECIEFAKQQYPALNASWIVSDFRLVNFGDNKPDIIFSSLFCHHFTNASLVKMLRWMRSNSRMGFFINDVHRHFFAYHSIKMITRIFSRSYLVRNDAPVSVTRGFRKNEWLHIITEAGIPHCTVRWKWAFRWLIVYRAPIEISVFRHQS